MKKIVVFDVQWVILYSHDRIISETLFFIENNYEKFDFFTNTSLPKKSLDLIFTALNLEKYFMELLSYDTWTKRENIEYIMQVYGTKPEDILFIDDKQSHIDAVKNTWVNTLLFEQDGVSLEEKIANIF